MKVRTGFVSNSSSSSFVVLFPKSGITFEQLIEKFGADKYANLRDMYDDVTDDSVRNRFDDLVWHGYISEDATSDGSYDVFQDLIRDYVIASVDGASGDGQIVLVAPEQIEKILKG